MITAPTFRRTPTVVAGSNNRTSLRIIDNDGKCLYIASFAERTTAKKAVARVEQMNEKGETIETIRRQIHFEFNKDAEKTDRFLKAHKDRLRQQYAQEIEWITSHTLLSSV